MPGLSPHFPEASGLDGTLSLWIETPVSAATPYAHRRHQD